jgi:hypothetical protein
MSKACIHCKTPCWAGHNVGVDEAREHDICPRDFRCTWCWPFHEEPADDTDKCDICVRGHCAELSRCEVCEALVCPTVYCQSDHLSVSRRCRMAARCRHVAAPPGAYTKSASKTS